MNKKRPTSYAWARQAHVSHTNPHELSERALAGYGYALELAEDAAARAQAVANHQEPQPPLTPVELAERDGRTTRQLKGMLKRARFELFGALTDSAIYKRARTLKKRSPSRACQQPSCTNTIPSGAPGQRRYCSHHATGAERTRRHRQRNNS